MVAVFATFQSTLTSDPRTRRVVRVLLPSADDARDWPELDLQPASVGGFGVFPNSTALEWSCLRTPVVLLYLGRETELSAFAARCLVKVVAGQFENVTLAQVMEAHEATRLWKMNGMFAVQRSAEDDSSDLLPPETRLLEVALDHRHSC